jgi:hypothetical protein
LGIRAFPRADIAAQDDKWRNVFVSDDLPAEKI